MKTRLVRGAYSNVAATLALVVAMSGTSYAAVALAKGSVGSREIATGAVASAEVKNRSLQAKDFKPGQLPSGAQGPAGPAGPAGAIGPQGPAGPLPDTLPSGKTLRGAFGFGQHTTAAGQVVQDGISYPFPLSASPTVRLVQAGDPPPPECPGSVTNPQAQPGNLCVYQRFRNNAGALQRYGPETQTTFRTGVVLFMTSAGVGSAETAGTWAVTAP